MFTANKPLRTPDDFKGLKFRIQSSKVLEEQMRALKAIPQVMAFSESYQALQTGVVDGTENTPSNIYTQKMHEVQKYLVAADHGYVGYAVIVNKRFWEGLPPDIRTELDQAMADATACANTIAYDENVKALEAIRKAGTTADGHPDARRAGGLATAALAPVQQTMAARIGRPLLQEVNAEIRDLLVQPVRVAASMSLGAGVLRGLDRLEETLIIVLMGAATAVIFAAVIHRFLVGFPIPGLQDAPPGHPHVLGPGAVHLLLRLDGQVRRRLWRAHRHPRRRGRADQSHGRRSGAPASSSSA